MEVYEQIAKRIRELRLAQGWSQEELAERAGMQQADVSRIESGRRRISIHALGRIADVFEVSIGELLR